jgi:hypothetical protein
VDGERADEADEADEAASLFADPESQSEPEATGARP